MAIEEVKSRWTHLYEMLMSFRGKLTTLLILALISASILSLHQKLGEPSLVKLLERSKGDPEAVKEALKVLRGRLKELGSPIVEGNKVIFVYTSEVPVEVWIAGDWNGWSPSADRLQRLGRTEVYYLIKEFPRDARLEYKLIVNDKWIPDPLNPRRAIDRPDRSVLMMPNYRHSPYLKGPKPELSGNLTSTSIKSNYLGRNVSIHIYTPPFYDKSEKYPLIFFQDGSDYIRYGTIRILDSMISMGEIRPVITVFIDPEFRSCEYAMDDSYVNFLAEELTPFLEERYGTSRSREDRCLVGASLGGLIALYAALTKPETFGLVITQSGAFIPPRVLFTVCPKVSGKDIFEVASEPKPLKLRIFMQWGEYEVIRWIDLHEENKRIAEILKGRGHEVRVLIVPEGHNWGNWINNLPIALKSLFEGNS